MLKYSCLRLRLLATLITLFALGACTPQYDWREVRGGEAPFTVLLPAKPASHSRPINLDGIQVTMSMTAAQVDDVTFAVGSARLSDPSAGQTALLAMKTAMVKNINGTIQHEKVSATGAGNIPVIEIEALGTASAGKDGPPRILFARFMAKGPWIYQLVVIGRAEEVPRDAVDTFFSSFKP